LKSILSNIGLDIDDLRVQNLRNQYPNEHDPFIDFEHFYYFVQILPAKLTIEHIVSAFHKIDKNCNGTISFQELNEALDELHLSTAEQQEIRKFTGMINSQAKLNMSQFLRIVKPDD